ncbi:MAG: zinc-ribbon domain-containing protein [Bryobacteraceae bacterium]|nr:zinc-ribbon domain-containing protein [Bryobacteraceae bacterium]
MPFCTQCGSEVQPTDTFCAACGAVQGGGASAPEAAPKSASSRDPFEGLDERRAAIFCYVPLVGWIASIVVLAAERFRNSRETRFHAFQGLYLFVAWLFVDWVFSPFTHWAEPMKAISSIMKVGVFGAWIFMLVKTSQGETFRLPLLGELADRSVSEQK